MNKCETPKEKTMSCHKWFLPIIAALWLAPILSAGAIEVSPAGTRTHFTNAKPIELALSGAGATALALRHSDGSTLTIQVPAAVTSRLVTIKEYSSRAATQPAPGAAASGLAPV